MRDNDFAGSRAVRLLLLYSEALAHLINAAADMVLVPSMYEPCGLTQLIAMRYGAVPVVRATGGLADTVRDVDTGDSSRSLHAFLTESQYTALMGSFHVLNVVLLTLMYILIVLIADYCTTCNTTRG